MWSKSIVIILSYTVSMLARFFETQCICVHILFDTVLFVYHANICTSCFNALFNINSVIVVAKASGSSSWLKISNIPPQVGF